MRRSFAYLNCTFRAKSFTPSRILSAWGPRVSAPYSPYFNTSRLRCSIFIPNRTVQLNKAGIGESRGFTIIELMIATLVFSVVLVVLTAGLLQIGRIYYKGLSSAKVQEVARGVVDDVAQTIQMAGGTIIPTNGTMNNGIVSGTCVGARRYSYVLGRELTATSHNRFVVDTVASGCTTGPGGATARSDTAVGTGMTGPLTGGGQELLGEKMRLVDFQVTQNATNPQLYSLLVRVAYGDDDLLCSPGMAGDCSVNGVSSSVTSGRKDLICKDSTAGTQFCAVSEIATTVEKRLR